MKWGEFIGTPVGEKMHLLLNEQFCPRHSTWGVASDCGRYEFPTGEYVPDDIYESAEDMEDVACHALFQKMARENNLIVSSELSEFWNNNTAMWKEMANQYPEAISMRSFMPPDLYSLIPRLRRRRASWASMFACMVFSSVLFKQRRSKIEIDSMWNVSYL
jgi:hypothetical protein